MDGVYRAPRPRLRRRDDAGYRRRVLEEQVLAPLPLRHEEDLLVAFLDHVISDSGGGSRPTRTTPVERLSGFIGWFVFEPEAIDREAFHIALLELRTQGRSTSRSANSSSGVIGCSAAPSSTSSNRASKGVFRDVDVEETAALLVATLDGARTRQITLSRGANAAGSPGMNGDRSDTDDSGRNGTGGSASEAHPAATRPEPEPSTPSTVPSRRTRGPSREATLRRIVEPLLAGRGATIARSGNRGNDAGRRG